MRLKPMPVALDHIFVCCEPGGPEADALRDIGLVEGSGRVHPGQGTQNRRFFFEGGFVELLWVSNAEEAQSPLTAPTRLWQRWRSRKQQACCPFGVAFSPTGEAVPGPPFSAWAYRPSYLPADQQILFADSTTLQEPELLYLAWSHPQRSSAGQPKDHPNGLRRLLSASVGLPGDTPLSAASSAVQSAGLLRFHPSERCEIHLVFSGPEQKAFPLAPALPLVLMVQA
jgi:hypothetical protein